MREKKKSNKIKIACTNVQVIPSMYEMHEAQKGIWKSGVLKMIEKNSSKRQTERQLSIWMWRWRSTSPSKSMKGWGGNNIPLK